MSKTSYAVLTRAKAKFGKRLTDKDYKALLDCENVAEVMTYLKSNTHYINAFGEANERGIRRGLFESLLKQYMTNEFDILSRYELSVGEDFSTYIAHKTEIDEIVRILTTLNSTEREKEQFHFTVPAHMAKKTTIDLNKLADAQDFSQVLAAMKGTKYEDILKGYTLPLPVSEIENRLYINLYKDLYEAIGKAGATESKELRDLFDTIIDYKNFISIIRLKKYYHSEPKTIRKHLIPFGSLTEKSLTEMCTADNADGVFTAMCNTRTGKLIEKIDYNDIGELVNRVKFRKAKHNMYLSDSPSTVMISYIILCEIELYNLICIIEGARYNVDKSKIEKLLIY